MFEMELDFTINKLVLKKKDGIPRSHLFRTFSPKFSFMDEENSWKQWTTGSSKAKTKSFGASILLDRWAKNNTTTLKGHSESVNVVKFIDQRSNL